ncbi:hypothetical protein FRC04_011419 [Tulasnella sp. 424]|nr:hypothetical protein FRC04_011419 [Tulasnella sp. 424]KAG8971941.1 hypothetical protein FRC05_010476 [Tulasnella sp. 425]
MLKDYVTTCGTKAASGTTTRPLTDLMSQNLDASSSPLDHDELPNRPSGLAEDVDWSAVRSHKRVQRKYGPRTDASTSSRSSVSSGLTEQFSSSGSDTADEDEGTRLPANAEAAPSGLFGKARHSWVKHRAKKLFLRFTTRSRHQTRTPAWRRRRDAADALMRIVSNEVGGEDIVARRFVKTVSRQKDGTNAILSLGVEECDRFDADPDTPGYIALQTSGVAARLLNLVVSHSKGSSFFSETIPSILRREDPTKFNPQASAAIPYLATAFPDHFHLTDPVLVQDFASSLVTIYSYPSLWWLRGIRILDILMNPVLPNAPRQQEMKHLLAAKVLGAVTQAFAPPLVSAHRKGPTPRAGNMLKYHPLRCSIPLRAAVSAIWIAGDSASAPESILPDSQDPVRFAWWLVKICTNRFDTDVGLALKALVLMRDIPEVKGWLSTANFKDLAARCVQLVLYQFPREMTASRKSADFEMQELKPDEDAFDILCYLEEPIFAQALESKLKPPLAASKLDSLDNDPSDSLRLLEPLLWLSNIPSDIKVAHRALVQSGACNFLAKIIPYPVSLTWKWEERDIWRAKGQAMTCLGNIIERMDESQLHEHVTKRMIDDVVAIKTNEEAPEAQRDQATFTLQRYQIVAGRCGIEPYYRELPNKPRGV